MSSERCWCSFFFQSPKLICWHDAKTCIKVRCQLTNYQLKYIEWWKIWYATGNFGHEQIWGSSAVTRSYSESIFSNSLVNTMEMRAAIQYILTAAQLLGSQDYHKVLNSDTWACWSIILPNEQYRRNGWSYVLTKILTWMLRESGGSLKATADNRVTTRLSLYPHTFLFFSVYSTRFLYSQAGYAQKHVNTYSTLWT